VLLVDVVVEDPLILPLAISKNSREWVVGWGMEV
jgi:hypothetical protein